MSMNVIITGASPDSINHNAVMRNYVYDGFVSLLSNEKVRNIPLQSCAKSVLEQPVDFVLVFGSCMPDSCEYGSIKHACDRTGAKLIFWLHDDPYEQDYNFKILDIADIVFTNDKWASKFYYHDNTFHLPMAASKNAHFVEITDKWERDLFFCGVAFENRVSLLRDLKQFLSSKNCNISGSNWPADLFFCKNERINNSELPNFIANSKFTLNVGRHLSLGNDRFKLDPSTPGPRTFEAAMAGSVQLYYVESLEIEEYYKPDSEILLFDSAKQLEQLFEEYVDDPEKLISIAKNAQDRTLNDHQYKNRCSVIIEKFLALN